MLSSNEALKELKTNEIRSSKGCLIQEHFNLEINIIHVRFQDDKG